MLATLLSWLAQPGFSLPSLFLIALLSATLLPLGSEPALATLVQLQPHLLWPAILLATAGNTLGGLISYAMGRGAHNLFARLTPAATHTTRKSAHAQRALRWAQRYGPKALLLSWLPLVGDLLCLAAGWLRLPLLPSALYMAIGKGLRYCLIAFAVTGALQAWRA